ncbi:MAG: 2-oxo acid dehydrogenase subunit E2, partial [Candidatus Binataceae bacterium]
VETDKADMVMESFDDGVLEEIRLKEGESAPVGATIATLRTSAESTGAASMMRPATVEVVAPAENSGAKPQPTAERVTPIRPAKRRAERSKREASTESMENPVGGTIEDATVAEAEAADEGGAFPMSPEVHPALSAHPSATPTAIAAPPMRAVATAEARPPVPHDGKLRASPLARRAADEAGIDLAQVHGSGPEGRITKRDIDNFVREQQLFRFRRLVAPREGLPGTREELSKMRRTIAQRMAQSKREIPHFYVTVEVDMEEAVKLKNSLEVTELFEEDITYNDIIVKATALGLARYTRMNASFQDDGVVIYPHINIGMAVAVEDGLIVPVIHECERLTLPEISAAAHRLVGKA